MCSVQCAVCRVQCAVCSGHITAELHIADSLQRPGRIGNITKNMDEQFLSQGQADLPIDTQTCPNRPSDMQTGYVGGSRIQANV